MKRFIAVILTLTLTLSLVPVAFAATDEASRAAQALYDLGLFQGTGYNADGTPNFDLDRTPTRAEAVTMLVRLLGKDAEAQAGSWTIPFTDVADWAKPYVGYAYTNGLTTGTGATTFGGEQTIDATQYLTFVLRALGYTSGTDFQWNSAWTKSDEIGLTDGRYNANTTSFTRGDVAIISESALSATSKADKDTLLTSLISAKAVTEKAADNYLNPPVKVESVSLSKGSLDLEVGRSETITAAVTPEDAADKTVTWKSSDTAVATVSNGTINAIAEGTATITAASTNGKSATCTVSVTAAPIVYSGTGDKVISGVNIPAGSYYAEYTHSGKSNFISKLYYGDRGYDYFRISNEIGVCSGQVALYDNSNTAISGGMLEVEADGDWTIAFKPVFGTSTTNIKGHGEIVTGIFTATSARYVVNLTHTGKSNFIAKIIKYNAVEGYDYESLVNEIGSYSGQKIVNLTMGAKYYVYVEADGDWTVDLGVGDSVTTYTQPTISSGGNGSGSSSSSSSSSSNSGSSSSSPLISDGITKENFSVKLTGVHLGASNNSQASAYIENHTGEDVIIYSTLCVNGYDCWFNGEPYVITVRDGQTCTLTAYRNFKGLTVPKDMYVGQYSTAYIRVAYNNVRYYVDFDMNGTISVTPEKP